MPMGRRYGVTAALLWTGSAVAFSPPVVPVAAAMLWSGSASQSAVQPARPAYAPARASASMGFFDNFLTELDNFVDDAANRRLGNGAKFYGKRKSSFYGEEDQGRKADPSVADPEEDWRGPGGGSFFVLSKERDEQGRPMGFLTKKQARDAHAEDEERKWESARKSDDLFASFASAVSDEEDASSEDAVPR